MDQNDPDHTSNNDTDHGLKSIGIMDKNDLYDGSWMKMIQGLKMSWIMEQK